GRKRGRRASQPTRPTEATLVGAGMPADVVQSVQLLAWSAQSATHSYVGVARGHDHGDGSRGDVRRASAEETSDRRRRKEPTAEGPIPLDPAQRAEPRWRSAATNGFVGNHRRVLPSDISRMARGRPSLAVKYPSLMARNKAFLQAFLHGRR